MPRITVSRDVHDAIRDHTLPDARLDDSTTVYNADGTVSFEIGADTLDRIRQHDPDPERAIRRILGLPGGFVN